MIEKEASPLSLFPDKKSSITVFSPVIKIDTKKCVVLFSGWGGRAFNCKVNVTDPLLREGFDVICVQSNCDDWHQNVFTCGISLLANYIKENYSSALGYETSMGAFGAILYSSRLRLNSILALSPQYTISDSFDQRWSQYDKKITWNYRMHNAIDYEGDIHVTQLELLYLWSSNLGQL